MLERFTRRAPSDWVISKENNSNIGNIYIKSIVNPRRVDYYVSPHFASCFDGLKSINSDGAETYRAGNHPICADKIVVNHYWTKSKEEYVNRRIKGDDVFFLKNNHTMEDFHLHDRNEVFDDGILNYRAVRAENFLIESEEQRRLRVEKTLTEILTQCSPFDVSAEFFAGKLETFLTCRALAEEFNVKIGTRSAEEYALVWIYQCLTTGVIKYSALQLFMSDLPNILARPFPLCKKILQLTRERVIPTICDELKFNFYFKQFTEFNYIRRLLSLIK